jgi:hypothetical protein
MRKRKWIYVHHPVKYDIRCDKCWNGSLEAGGGTNIYWSEYEGMIWCYDCKIDIHGFRGIFDGPIPLGVMEVLGLSLNRLYFKSNKIFKPVVNKNRRVVYRRCSDNERAWFKRVRKIG